MLQVVGPAQQACFGRLYRGLIDAGVMSVMSARVAWPAFARHHGAQDLAACWPASISGLLNQTLLRGELGFNGVIMSDASAMAGLGRWGQRSDFVPEIIASGHDILLFATSFESDLQHLRNGLCDG